MAMLHKDHYAQGFKCVSCFFVCLFVYSAFVCLFVNLYWVCLFVILKFHSSINFRLIKIWRSASISFQHHAAASSSSAFDMMVALTRFFLPRVPHIWMSGANPLQTPRAWFWGTHKWAISAALLADGVSRTVGSVLVFGPPLHRGIVRRSLRQSSWDGYSVCSGLFWGERWWSVGVASADGAHPGLGCILQSCSGRRLSFYYG